jgi:hypothetical protein
MFRRFWAKLFGPREEELEDSFLRLRMIQTLSNVGTPHADALANELMKQSLREIGITEYEDGTSRSDDSQQKI